MTTERKPAFWRVVRVVGVREYLRTSHSAGGDWTTDLSLACTFPAKPGSNRCGGRTVPVYVTVRKVPRGHDLAWALRRMKEGKRVTRPGAKPGSHIWIVGTTIVDDNGILVPLRGPDIMCDDWVLAEAAP